MSKKEIVITIEDGFKVLDSRLEILAADRAVISSRQAEIEKYLGQYISKFVMVLTGGYSRSTMISPLKNNHIDLHILFSREHSQTHLPDVMLEKLFVTLEAEYPGTENNEFYKSVLVPFPELTFNITPGFIEKDGTYLVPDRATGQGGLALDTMPGLTVDELSGLKPGNSWVHVDYMLTNDWLENENRKHAGYLKPVIKMMKCWNRENNGLFDAYYLELMVTKLLTDVKITSYSQTIKYIFKKAKANVAFTTEDPAQNNAMIEGLRDVKVLVDGMLYLQEAYIKARDAEHFESKGRIKQAYKEWESLFPGFFPSAAEMVIQQIELSGVSGAKALEMMRDSMS